MSVVYKILPKDVWDPQSTVFKGWGIDTTDGFIHFSSGQQVKDTAARFFSGQDNLCLVAVDGSNLDLRWESAVADGDKFPHLYGELDTKNVLWVKDMPLGENGVHVLPEELK